MLDRSRSIIVTSTRLTSGRNAINGLLNQIDFRVFRQRLFCYSLERDRSKLWGRRKICSMAYIGKILSLWIII